jgi:AcrR family transcriptional regulator
VTRRYELKRRGERQDETRQRIIDATIELHQTIGPAATTVTEIAQRANVGRVTVYRHFPDEAALSRACSGHYFALHPLPDLAAWRAVQEPGARVALGLAETYRYHRATQAMLGHALADAREHPVLQPYHEHWERAVDVLAAGWNARGKRRVLLRAALALALSFDTWQTLTREHGLSDDDAVELMLKTIS